MELRRFEYHPRWRAFPLTRSRDFLMKTECTAATALLITPKVTPVMETCTPSRKTPIKNPIVTTAHDARISFDGREESMTNDVKTVKGRTSPLATW
jgi:hypothetical protein